jgi:VCBS repeat-containing protein
MSITFNNTYLAGITGQSAAFQTTFTNLVNSVEGFFIQQLSDTVTLNVTFDWQPLNVGYPGPPAGFTLGSNNFARNDVSYADLRNALINHVSTNNSNPEDDAAATAALPATDPAPTTGTNSVRYQVTNGEEKLLGLNGVGPNDNLGADATITLASDLPNGTFFDFDRSDGISANGFDAFAVIAHEITEGLFGRIMSGGSVPTGGTTNDYNIMDLFHFTAGGTRAMLETGGNNLFSFSGTTRDANLNRVLDNSGDIADPASSADPRDSFADGRTGVINAISQTDLRILDVLGWTRINGLDDHNQSDTAATTVLNAGVTNGINGSLELQGDHDWFKVILDPTKHYAISVEGAATGAGTLADPFVALYAGAGASRDTSTPVLTADDGGVGANSMLLTGFGRSGTFFVDVGSIGTAPEAVAGKVQDIGTGTYLVTLIGNAPPVLSADTGSPHAKTELFGTTNSPTLDQVSGTLSFTDVDVGDTHTASAGLNSEIWSGGATIPLATQAALAGALSDSISVDGTAGALTWQFSLADRNVDFLAVAETLTTVYNVTVMDHHSGSPFSDSSTQQVTVVFTGANDTPMVDAGSSVLTNAISELPNVTNSSTVDSTAGVVAFSDPDLNDKPTATLNTAGETVTWQDATHNYTSELMPAQISLFEAAASIGAEAGNTNTGNIDWHYDIVDKNLDFLGGGESLTVTAPILIDDHHGGVFSQNIVVTINGADDNPIAAADSNATSKNSTLSVAAANGVLANDTDPDVHDQGHLFVGAVDGSAANVGHFVAGTYGSVDINANGGYIYTPNKGGLPSNFVAQDAFTYTVADGHGGTDTSTLSIIVTNPNVDYLAGANTTLIGGNGKQVLDGSAGHDVLIGGNSPDVLVGGVMDTLTGGNGPDTFLFRPQFGANTITDFDFRNDAIQLDSSIFAGVTGLLSHTTDTANGAVINDTHGDTITLTNVTVAELHAHAHDIYLV